MQSKFTLLFVRIGSYIKDIVYSNLNWSGNAQGVSMRCMSVDTRRKPGSRDDLFQLQPIAIYGRQLCSCQSSTSTKSPIRAPLDYAGDEGDKVRSVKIARILRDVSCYYSTVHAPPSRQNIVKVSRPMICGMAPSTARQPDIATPLAIAGKVVANTAVGFGDPETVTVGTEGTVADELVVSPMENLGDVPYITPIVEFMKRR